MDEMDEMDEIDEICAKFAKIFSRVEETHELKRRDRIEIENPPPPSRSDASVYRRAVVFAKKNVR